MSNLSGNDLVYYKENGKVMSGGFDINSILMKQGISPFSSLNSNNSALSQTGGSSVSNLFKSLAVPSGLLYLHEKKRHHKQFDYLQTGGKKKMTDMVPEDNDEDEDEESSSSSSSSSSEESDSEESDSDEEKEKEKEQEQEQEKEKDSNKYVEDSEVLSEDIFKKCLDIVTKMEIAKQKAQKKKSSKNVNKPQKKKQTKKKQPK